MHYFEIQKKIIITYNSQHRTIQCTRLLFILKFVMHKGGLNLNTYKLSLL
jgi:hypothetical protein